MNFSQISDTSLLCKSFTCHLLIFDQSSVENTIGGEGSFARESFLNCAKLSNNKDPRQMQPSQRKSR